MIQFKKPQIFFSKNKIYLYICFDFANLGHHSYLNYLMMMLGTRIYFSKKKKKINQFFGAITIRKILIANSYYLVSSMVVFLQIQTIPLQFTMPRFPLLFLSNHAVSESESGSERDIVLL